MIAAILSTTTMANASSLAISVANDDAGIFQPSLNALYGHPAADRGDYTAGLFLGYSHDLTDASQLSFHIAQDIYSPSGANKRKPEAVKGDRAFSAFLHTGLEWNSLATNWLRYRLGTDIGVIGPDAGGQEVQNRAHRIIGAENTLPGRIKLKTVMVTRQKEWCPLRQLLIFWASMWASIQKYLLSAAISSSIWGTAQPLRWEMIRPSTLIMGLGYCPAEGLIHTQKRD